MFTVNNSYLLPNPISASGDLPAGAEEILQAGNPRLLELRRRYAAMEIAALKPSVWDEVHTSAQLDLRFFRGDNAYVWQKRDNNEEINYLLTAYYYQQFDQFGLLEKLTEDEAFGIFTYPFRNGKLISRDLLDSIGEIYFLEQTLQLSKQKDWNILDIGAGYGRLAHRMVTAFPGIRGYYCTDAVPESTFLSEFYLQYRQATARARVIPLDEIEAVLKKETIQLAVNIHSFTECTAAATRFWLELLRKYAVPYLLIVPNALHEGGEMLYSKELDESEPELSSVIRAAGYELLIKQPKYTDPGVQQYGVTPTWYHLFQLKN